MIVFRSKRVIVVTPFNCIFYHSPWVVTKVQMNIRPTNMRTNTVKGVNKWHTDQLHFHLPGKHLNNKIEYHEHGKGKEFRLTCHEKWDMYSSRFKEMLAFTGKKYWYQNQTIMVICLLFNVMNSKCKTTVHDKNHGSALHNFTKKTTTTETNNEFVPELVMLLLFTSNQRNKQFSIFWEPKKGSHHLSKISWTNKRSFSSALAYCCWAFLWFVALTAAYLCSRSPHWSGHCCRPFGQFFSWVSRSRLDALTLQKPQGNRWDGKTAKCLSFPLLRYLLMQRLGHFTNINGQLTLWSLMLRCSPTHSQLTLVQRTIIFYISALTTMFIFKLPGVMMMMMIDFI